MKPQWYCEAIPLTVNGDSGASGAVLRSQLLSVLHGLFARRPGTFAVAFPDEEQLSSLPAPFSGALRLFASSRENMDWLAENTCVHPWFRDYARLSYPQSVPDDFSGTWTRFVRYRIPSLSADRHEGEAYGSLRRRRMAEAGRVGMTYFILKSTRTGQRFSLVVSREPGEAQHGECVPNGYGFCVSSRPFSLPELPWV